MANYGLQVKSSLCLFHKYNLLEQSHIHLSDAYGGFCTARAEVTSYNRDNMTYIVGIFAIRTFIKRDLQILIYEMGMTLLTAYENQMRALSSVDHTSKHSELAVSMKVL